MKNHNFSHFNNFTFIDVRKMIQKTIKKKKKKKQNKNKKQKKKKKIKHKKKKKIIKSVNRVTVIAKFSFGP